MTRGMEHLCSAARLREFGVFSLEEKKLWGDLRALSRAFKGHRRAAEGLGT